MGLNALTDVGSRVLTNIIPQSVHNAILGTFTDWKPSPHAGTQPQSAEQPRASRTRAHSGLMTSDTPPSKALVQKGLFGGTGKYDPINIDLDEDIQEISALPKKKTRASTNSISHPANPTKTTADRHERNRVSSEEARTLGLGETIPADAVQIQIPSNKPEMPFKQKNKPFRNLASNLRGGYQPMDTLNSPRQSKHNFQYATTRQHSGLASTETSPSQTSLAAPFKASSKPSAAGQSQHQTRSTLAYQGRTVDGLSNKRRKLESPARPHSTREPNAPSEMPQVKTTSPHIIPSDSGPRGLASAYGFEELETDLSNHSKDRVKHTPLRSLATHSASVGDTYHDRMRADSPDDLIEPSKARSESPGQFFKSARQQRFNGQYDSDDDQDMHMRFVQAKKSTNIHTATRERTQAHRPPASITPKTSRQSKIAARLEAESPDQLHSLEQTSRRAKNTGLPLSPPEQFPIGRKFRLRSFVCTGYVDTCNYEVEVFEDNRTFSLKYWHAELGQDALIDEIPVSKIISVLLPEESGDVHIAMLKLRSSVVSHNMCFLEFTSEKSLNDFVHLVSDLDNSIKTQVKPLTWIENAMGKTHATSQHMSNTRKPNIHNTNPHEVRISNGSRVSLASPELSTSRLQLKDTLDAPQGQSVERMEIDRPERSERNLQQQKSTHQGAQTVTDSRLDSSRQTRSRSNRADRAKDAYVPQLPQSEPRRHGPEWQKPLYYPRDGIRRDMVTWDDLLRLEDDEFLNDSLVSFFMRYLQESMDQEELKRMHFFNTFFYETLMRPSGNKGGRRQINYKGVAKWTKNINLFKRDYVVVPVNESSHWYVMIICNLRSLLPENQASVDAIEGQAIATAEAGNNENHNSPLVPDGQDVSLRDTLNERTISPVATGPVAGHTDKKRPGRAKKVPRQLPRYPIDKPMIITLDSLDSGRSMTASVLKDYLAEEAKERYELDIDRGGIRGMTAKDIPLQGNFSDCGLYLCMYLEKFVEDPQKFVSSLLQRDTEAIQWPKRMESGALRQRLYDMLQEIYMAHLKKVQPNVPPVGKILIRDEDLLSDEQRRVQSGLDYLEDYSRKRKGRSAERTDSEAAVTSDARLTGFNNRAGQDRDSPASVRYRNGTNAIVIDDDDSQVRSAPQDGCTSRFFAGAPKSSVEDVSRAEDTPQGLAAQLKQRRSPESSIQLSTIEMPTRCRSPEKVGSPSSTLVNLLTPNDETTDQQRRSVSVDTAFLSGNASYDIHLKKAAGDDSTKRKKEVFDAQYHQQQEEEEEDVFEGFDDDNVAVQCEARRHSSVVPESDFGDETTTVDIMQVDDTAAPDEMLLQ